MSVQEGRCIMNEYKKMWDYEQPRIRRKHTAVLRYTFVCTCVCVACDKCSS